MFIDYWLKCGWLIALIAVHKNGSTSSTTPYGTEHDFRSSAPSKLLGERQHLWSRTINFSIENARSTLSLRWSSLRSSQMPTHLRFSEGMAPFPAFQVTSQHPVCLAHLKSYIVHQPLLLFPSKNASMASPGAAAIMLTRLTFPYCCLCWKPAIRFLVFAWFLPGFLLSGEK